MGDGEGGSGKQNFARELMEKPVMLTPSRVLPQYLKHSLAKSDVDVPLSREDWMKDHHMNAFLKNTKGSY